MQILKKKQTHRAESRNSHSTAKTSSLGKENEVQPHPTHQTLNPLSQMPAHGAGRSQLFSKLDKSPPDYRIVTTLLQRKWPAKLSVHMRPCRNLSSDSRTGPMSCIPPVAGWKHRVGGMAGAAGVAGMDGHWCRQNGWLCWIC